MSVSTLHRQAGDDVCCYFFNEVEELGVKGLSKVKYNYQDSEWSLSSGVR